MRSRTNEIFQILLFTLFLFLGGCSSAGTAPGLAETGYSKLEGRWSITYPEMQRALTGKIPSSDVLGETANRRIVVLTIRPDGSIDWSRSESGVSFGLQGLEKGDQSVGLRYQSGRFEVTAADYTPTRSHVEIRGLSRDEGIAQSLSSAVIDVELQSDGVATAEITLDTYSGFSIGTNGWAEPTSDPERSQLKMRLHRHDPRPHRHDCISQLAGYWGGPEGKIALIIRRDGTFDWSGTIEGMLGGWQQLERKGDLSFNRMDGSVYAVTDHLYRESESMIKVQMDFVGEDGKSTFVAQKLSAKYLDDKSIAFDVYTEGGEWKKSHSRAILHRGKEPGERAESVLSEIERLSGGTERKYQLTD